MFDGSITAVFDKDWCEAGEQVTMKVVLADAENVNTTGYNIQYDFGNMAYMHTQPGDNLAAAASDIDRNAGMIGRALYVTPAGETLTAGPEGVVVDTVTFIMLKAGAPEVQFALDEDSADFNEDSAFAYAKDGTDSVILYLSTGVDYEKSVTDAEEAAADVDALIQAIGEVTYESGDAITAAREAYEALTDAQKEYVTKLGVLEEAETVYGMWAKGDINMDGVINMVDLSVLLSSYGTDKDSSDID